MYWGVISYILYTYDIHHNFGRALTVEKFNLPANLSQFKHCLFCVQSHSMELIKPKSITPTLQQSPQQVPDKVTDLSWTQIMKVGDTNHVADFHDFCPRQVRDFVGNLLRTLSPTFPVHCNGLNCIRATQTGLSWTWHGFCCKHARWFVSATFMICVHDFPRGEVSVKVA